MRKSLLKTPPSGLSSRPPRRRAALVAVGAGRRPPNEGIDAETYNTSRASFDVDPQGTLSDAETAARLRLLETLVSRADITECAQVGLQWLEETYGIARSICLVRPIGEAS